VIKSEIKIRQTENWKYKYEEYLDCGFPNFSGGQIPDKCPPQFTFTIDVQEIECRVDLKDGSIKEGTENKIVDRIYRVTL
jgi:hypothetical protein